MDIPTKKKTFKLEFEVKRKVFGFIPWTKNIYGEFEQPALQQVHLARQQLGKTQESMVMRAVEFLKENTNIKKTDFKFIIHKLDKIIEFLMETYFEWVFWWDWKQEYDRTPFDVWIMSLAENNVKDYYWIINNLTVPQVIHMFDCKVWNMNATTKEWKARNKKRMMQEWSVKEKYNKQFEAFDKILAKKRKWATST